MEPGVSLKTFLDQTSASYPRTFEPLEFRVPGWHFFQGEAVEEPDTRFYWVVREDGTVVREVQPGELATILRSLGLPAATPARAPDELAAIAVCLLAEGERLIETEEAAQLTTQFERNVLFAPQLEPPGATAGAGATLRFWTMRLGRNMTLRRYQVTVPLTGPVTFTSEAPPLRR